MSRRVRGDGGAAAVEFALVVPILLALLLGIVDYGLYFSDSLAVRHGIREGAREGATSIDPPCSSPTNMDCLAEDTNDRIGAVGGETFVRVETVGTGGWRAGNELLVCAITLGDGVTGLTPMPGPVENMVRMRIEHDTTSATVGQTGTPPGGWAWCG